MKNQDEERPFIKPTTKWWERLIFNTKFQIVLVIILCVLIGVGTPFLWQYIWPNKLNCCAIESDLRYECLPLKAKSPHLIKEEDCNPDKDNSRCCWNNDSSIDKIYCFYPLVAKEENDKIPHYIVTSESKAGDNEITAKLSANNKSMPHYLKSNPREGGPVLHPDLLLSVTGYSDHYFTIHIQPDPKDGKTADIDYSQYTQFKQPVNKAAINADITLVSTTKTTCPKCFMLKVKRRNSDEIIFNTGDFTPFIFSDGLIEMTTLLPNDFIYGLGQSPSHGFKHNMSYPENWSIFNKYNLNMTGDESSWFGSHPMYMGWTNDNKPYGILLENTYPMQLVTNSRPSLTFRTIGGHLKFHFFLGNETADIYKQIIQVVGSPAMPPYWALGFHMCRTDVNDERGNKAVEDMFENGIPFDSDCYSAAFAAQDVNINDKQNPWLTKLKDKFNANKHFTDNTSHPLKSLLVQVPHKLYNIKTSPKIPWIQFSETDKTPLVLYDANSSQPFIGYFFDWTDSSDDDYDDTNSNVTVIFPDFMDSRVKDLLINELNHSFTIEKDKFDGIDGIFVDYNTPLDLSFNVSKVCQQFLQTNDWNRYTYEQLSENTPCLDLVYPSHKSMSHIALHNLYGHQQMTMTNDAFNKYIDYKKRPLIMSLSTFAGSGRVGGHIGTNMVASWEMLVQSMYQTLEFSLFGIPLTGFPVCGFTGDDLDPELCTRWYQTAALQPFMISHRAIDQDLTDPISLFGSDEKSLNSVISAITIRYRLLPYFYTLFYLASKPVDTTGKDPVSLLYGEPVIRPLFYHFGNDTKTHRIDKQYMWGPALMVSPITEPKINSLKAYFPTGIWYDYYSGQRISSKSGRWEQLSAVESHINLHVRGGHIIPTQLVDESTDLQRKNQTFSLIAAFGPLENRTAEGYMYIDDNGISVEPNSNNSLWISIEMNENENLGLSTITIHTKQLSTKLLDKQSLNTIINEIKVFGVIEALDPPFFNYTMGTDKPIQKQTYIYDNNDGVLTLMKLGFDFNQIEKPLAITWQSNAFTSRKRRR